MDILISAVENGAHDCICGGSAEFGTGDIADRDAIVKIGGRVVRIIRRGILVGGGEDGPAWWTGGYGERQAAVQLAALEESAYFAQSCAKEYLYSRLNSSTPARFRWTLPSCTASLLPATISMVCSGSL